MKIQIISGSIRDSRVTPRVATWVERRAKLMEGVDIEVVDLKNYNLPLFNEPLPPQGNKNRQPATEVRKWLDKLSEADAYIIVSPEYNRAMPGAMKNALDHIALEFKQKPIGLVTHGSAGGSSSMSTYRIVLPQLLAVTVPEPVMVVGAERIMDEKGVIEASQRDRYNGMLNRMLQSLKWYGAVLFKARNSE